MKIAALIVAAGRGTRAGGPPKQYASLGGRTIVATAIDAFDGHPAVGAIAVVIHAEDRATYDEAVGASAKLLAPVTGGATRQASVLQGLEALASEAPDAVLIHDAARPFVSAEVITRVIDALQSGPGALAAMPVADTLKREGAGGLSISTVDRDGLWRAQTPQGFHFPAILDAHRRAAAAQLTFTDDAAIAEWAGIDVKLVAGSERNVKLTTSEDMAMAQQAYSGDAFETRSASGFDVHRFAVGGDHVWLGGVKIPHSAKLDGHSDADVVLHALTDALLGTIGDGDIGQHFPPSDPQWKGAASHLFLEDAARRVRARGGRIVNVDATILAEAPKIGPHRLAMQAAIAAMVGVDTGRVGIKATTTEGLGFTGRGEGIAAMATATVELPTHRSPS